MQGLKSNKRYIQADILTHYRIANFIVAIYFITTLILPAAIFNKILFVMLAVMYIPLFLKRSPLVKPFFTLATIFLLNFILSFVGVVDRGLSLHLILSISSLLLVFIVLRFNINVDFIVKLSGISLCMASVVFFIAIVGFPSSPLTPQVFEIYTKYGLGAYGIKGYSDTEYVMFHLATTPFLYLPFCLFLGSFLKTKSILDLLALVLIVIILITSFSRGVLGISIIAGTIILISAVKKIWIPIVFPTLLIVTISGAIFLAFTTTVFSTNEGSNNTKLGHYSSFKNSVTPIHLLFGEGLAAFYYSEGRHQYVPETEITPADFIRYMGLIPSLIVFYTIIFPINTKRVYVGENLIPTTVFILYVFLSFTNPVLFNSAGLLIVVWYWTKLFQINHAAVFIKKSA